MIPTWYNTDERLSALDSAAASWFCTPFRVNSAVPGAGGGVSCHNLFCELHFATGCLARFSVPRGYPQEFLHGNPDRLVSQVDASLQPLGWASLSATASVSSLVAGDLLVIRFGRIASHLVTLLPGGLCIHVLNQSGVVVTPLLAALATTTKHAISIAAIRRPSP